MPTVAGDARSASRSAQSSSTATTARSSSNLAATLRQAPQDTPLARALQGDVKVGGRTAGPISVAMTVTRAPRLGGGFALDQIGIGPDDARKARLVAGSAIARLDPKTAMAFGFSEGAKEMERRLRDVEPNGFLIAKDIAGETGFAARRARQRGDAP